MIFLKPNTAVIGPGDPVVIPPQSREVHYEGELAVIIGKVCKDVPRERALSVVFGYTCGNDVTARDLQRSDGQWSRAKGFDTFAPIGPWVETELDPSGLRLTTPPRRRGRPGRYDRGSHPRCPHAQVRVGRLHPALGDIILTGTPAGWGPSPPASGSRWRSRGSASCRTPSSPAECPPTTPGELAPSDGRTAPPTGYPGRTMSEKPLDPVRLRVAPSPTGDPHVGTAYVSLFDPSPARIEVFGRVLVQRR